MFTFDLKITKKEWLDHTEKRWNAGLAKAGMAFHNQLSRTHYPPINPDSKYIRTFMTAKKANFKITEIGKTMEFGSTYYLPYLLMPAKTVQNWKEKKGQIIEAMKIAYKQGVKEFRE